MTEPVGLQGRVTRLEQEMDEVRHLARSTDREVADVSIRLSAQTRVINALRETQIEHGDLLKSHSEILKSHDKRLDSLEIKVDRLEAKVDRGFTMLAAGQERITDLLTRHIEESGGCAT
jgi:septal ring factor EnvC (AmiA/AmiB activator)